MSIYDQQGGDITAQDMITPDEDSDLRNFYSGSTVFITGATGFLGKLCMEKLLRVTDVKRIYILIRPKKGKEPKKRFEELFDEPSFDPLKRSNPNFTEKVSMVMGDCSIPDLGLSDSDRQTLAEEVDCVFHFAATVRFDEKLRMATAINVRGVRDIIRLARQMKKLRAIVHVSTAFSNCNRKKIEEKLYDPPITGEKLMTLVDCLDDERLNAITKDLLGDFPNTYAFTKCVAEDIVKKESKNLPIALYRPSIVIATAKEPVAGWIDNVYGATGVLMGAAVGLLRSLYGNAENRADMVPADYVINSVLATAWDVANARGTNPNKEVTDSESKDQEHEQDLPIYNYVSTPQNPITWTEFKNLSYKHCVRIPSEKVIWHYFFKIRSNWWSHVLAVFFLHTVPAYIVDFIAVCLGKKPMLVEGYKKIDKFADVISYFTMHEWDWTNLNTQALWNKLKPQDKELFEFDIASLDWNMYFYTYTRGARVYILKDPLDTVSKGRVKYWKLFICHYTLMAVLFFLMYKLLMLSLSFIFRF